MWPMPAPKKNGNAPPRRRRPKHDPRDSEQEILKAAEQALRERPFREVTVDEVMSRTGLKRPAFYVHFHDRYDLVLRVVQHIGKELFAIAEYWLSGENPLRDARKSLRGLVDVYSEHGQVLRALADASVTDARVEQAYRGLVTGFIRAAAEHIRQEQKLGRVDANLDANETARALIWLEERYLYETLGRLPQSNPDAVLQVLFRIWTATLYGKVPER